MAKQNIPEIKLTDNPLTNIIKMAPYLNEIDQIKTLYLMVGLYGGMETDEKRAG